MTGSAATSAGGMPGSQAGPVHGRCLVVRRFDSFAGQSSHILSTIALKPGHGRQIGRRFSLATGVARPNTPMVRLSVNLQGDVSATRGSRGLRQRRIPMIKIIILASGLGILASAAKLHAAAILTNAPPVNGRLVISWSSRGTLETAQQISGPWSPIGNARSATSTRTATNSAWVAEDGSLCFITTNSTCLEN